MATIYKKQSKDYPHFKLEDDMYLPFVFNRASLSYPLVFKEFWFQDQTNFRCPQIADICFLHKDKNRTIAYELKLSDWKKVLDQALINSDNFSFSGICMPDLILKRHYDKMKEKCEKYNIEVVSLVFSIEGATRKIQNKWEDRYFEPLALNHCYFLKTYRKFNYKQPNKNLNEQIINRAENIIPSVMCYQNGVELITRKWLPYANRF